MQLRRGGRRQVWCGARCRSGMLIWDMQLGWMSGRLGHVSSCAVARPLRRFHRCSTAGLWAPGAGCYWLTGVWLLGSHLGAHLLRSARRATGGSGEGGAGVGVGSGPGAMLLRRRRDWLPGTPKCRRLLLVAGCLFEALNLAS